MTRLADDIVQHDEKHALAWEADRRNSSQVSTILINQAGFETLDHVVEAPPAGGRTVWLCRAR